MSQRVVLEDAKLFALALNPAAVNSFPFLKPLLKRPKSCCDKVVVDTNAIKATIAGLTGTNLQTFKQRLGATTLRVVYEVGGQIVKKDI